MEIKGYDSNKILPTPGARHHSLHPLQREPQPEAYKMGHQVENLFARLKDWRGIATGYDRWAHIFSLLSSWTPLSSSPYHS